MKTIAIDKLRWDLTHIGDEVERGARFLVTTHGRPVFVLVPLSDLPTLGQTLPSMKRKRPARSRPK